MTVTTRMLILAVGILVFFFGAISVSAEPVNLEGTVTNQANKPVANAKVTIASDSSINTTTDSTGHFTLTGQITPIVLRRPSISAPSVALYGRYLRVILSNPASVTIHLHTVSGRSIYRFTTGMLATGISFVGLPEHRSGTGCYIMTVLCEGREYVYRYVSAGSDKKSIATRGNGKSDGVSSLSAPSSVLHAAVDALIVSASGYKSSTSQITSYTQNGIEIILEQLSRLDNITKSCEEYKQPAPISGGQSGWGSRYWDCCKPHCAWPENTTRYVANCGIDGTTEIPCFKEVGNEYWTGLEGTKSGCDQGGEAFMCYRHVPFAVCKDLAFGFAAVPGAGDDACGKCFQLDFDGGFKHGEPKAAHAMVKGKTMIVMASNIGHDVSGGQFDIMIPGGGLGAFHDGCAKQWNVDVTDENVVGKGNGGLISKCQEKLGWDADPEDLKTCVTGMCDNLFGKDPALHDLWEGCIWYAQWMHAVDNPTFTYKEIECPQDLIDLYYSTYHPKP